MTKILIINAGSSQNKGVSALIFTITETIKTHIPDAEFVLHSTHKNHNITNIKEKYLIFSTNLDMLSKKPFKLTVGPLFLLFKCIVWNILAVVGYKNNKLINEERLMDYYNADIIIPTGGDNLSEEKRFSISTTIFLFNILLGTFLNKPIVFYAETIGSFKSRIPINKMISKFILNKSKLIILREEISKVNLIDIGIKKKLYVTADSAFLLNPVSQKRTEEIMKMENIDIHDRPIVGISASKMIFNEDHTKIMANVVDYLVEKLDATVIFVPHVVVPFNDDRTTADEICYLVKNRNRIISIKNEYSAQELKGIIGQCDLFIGTRMHAMIASTSMFVPTIGIAYSGKTYGVIGNMLGLERYIIDIKKLSYNDMTTIIDEIWKNRDNVVLSLTEKIPRVKERAISNGKLVNEFIESIVPSCNKS